MPRNITPLVLLILLPVLWNWNGSVFVLRYEDMYFLYIIHIIKICLLAIYKSA